MQNLKVLNKKETRKILEKLEKHFGIKRINLDYGFLQNQDGRIFLISKDITKLDTTKLKINSLGLYFAKLNHDIRLTIEGTQLIGDKATKNIVEINKDDTLRWVAGNDLDTNAKVEGYTIIKYDEDYIGCGKYKDGKILNFIPKARRIKW